MVSLINPTLAVPLTWVNSVVEVGKPTRSLLVANDKRCAPSP
jgi:hypothetical protein